MVADAPVLSGPAVERLRPLHVARPPGQVLEVYVDGVPDRGGGGTDRDLLPNPGHGAIITVPCPRPPTGTERHRPAGGSSAHFATGTTGSSSVASWCPQWGPGCRVWPSPGWCCSSPTRPSWSAWCLRFSTFPSWAWRHWAG